MWMPHAVGWLLDVFVVIVLAAILGGVGWGLRRCRFSASIWSYGYSVLLFSVGLLLASYPALLAEFLAFPVNVFRANTATASFFVTEYLGWRGLWPLLIPCMMVGVFRFVRWTPHPTRRLMLVVVPVILLSTATLSRPAPQPLVYSAQDLLKTCLRGDKRVVPSLARPMARSPIPENPAFTAVQLDDLMPRRYDHILVMVLEGVTTARFEEEFLSRPRGYYDHVRDQSVYFDRYHTTNLDSYTSLIAMLTSVQVPYRAYADPSSYEAVNQGPNLVAALNKRGFQSLFICTAEHQPFVPVREDWSQTLHMRDLRLHTDWLTMGGSKVEAGVEDRAALPAIIDFMKSHSRSLIMQEMIFGHSPKWMAKRGRSQLEYYDDYLLDILNRLEERDLADRVLLVVLSDHGDRTDPFNVENYNVPLLITGCEITAARNSALYCHTDLPALIGHFLAEEQLPPGRTSLLTVGSTERWVYGEITSSGCYMFIDNDRGTVSANQGAMNARSLYERFQSQLDMFAARFQR